MNQAHLLYSGHVQGVGFRYTVQRMAVQLQLSGWVKNLPNGQVEALVQGPKKDITRLCDNIAAHFSSNIQDQTVQWASSESDFSSFEICY